MTLDESTNGTLDEDQLIKSQMEKMVDSYDAYMRRVTFGRERRLREMTVSLAQVHPGDRILEVGCGTGTLTMAARQKAGTTGSAFGIDLIPGMIELCRQKAAQANLDITYQVGSMAEIPFPADRFDVVLCSFMIFHMSAGVRSKGLAEVRRVLKPGGRLLIFDLSLPTRPIARGIAKVLLGWMLDHDLRELTPLLEVSGFYDLETAPAKFRVLGLPVLAYVRARALKN
jgi:ubiquinone/menaquinone biosynthesis C-methylase UbiE